MSQERDRDASPASAPIWRLEATREVYGNRMFRVEERAMRGPQGKTGDFYVLQCSSWVNVVALTGDDHLVLVEQWRHAVAHPTLEIPGGVIDEDEPPFEAARRELLEETGYGANAWFELGLVEPNPATHANRCYTFLALGAEPRGAQALDENEDCRVVVLPFEEVVRRSAEGGITHALVVAALHYERLRRDGRLKPRPLELPLGAR